MMLLQQRRHLDLGQQHGCLEDKAMKRELYAGKTEDREMVKTPVITDEARRMMLVTGPNLCEEDTARQTFTTALENPALPVIYDTFRGVVGTLRWIFFIVLGAVVIFTKGEHEL